VRKFLLFAVIVVIAAIAGGIVAYNVFMPQKDPLAAQREQLDMAVRLAGTPLTDSPQALATDYNSAAARLAAIYEKRSQDFDNPELTKAWAQIESDVDGSLLILKQIAVIDQEKPSNVELVSNALQDDDKEKDQAFWSSIGVRLVSEAGKAQLEEKFRQAGSRLDRSIAGLQSVASGLAGPEIQNAVSVRYLPSWQGRLWGDEVQVQNTSGNALTDAAIVVTSHSRDGSSKVHLHYVDQWPSGTALSALYGYQPTDYSSSQAVEDPASVDVAVYLPTATARASYALTQDEWDNIVKSYSSRLSFTGTDLGAYVEDQTNNLYPPGYQFQFQGLPTLPVKSLELRFASDTGDVKTADFTFPGNEIDAGVTYPLRSAALADAAADHHVEYTLTFFGTNYQHTVEAH